MEVRIQSLILPTDEKHQQCRRLFYRGDHAILDRDKKLLKLGFGQHVDFTTYINACSLRKWQQYTNIGHVKLHLILKGSAEIDFVGYHKNALTVYRQDFAHKKFNAKTKREITFEFPTSDEQMIGFELSALSQCTIYGGYYTTNIQTKDINDVTLAINTTTCRKEEFVKKNLKLLADEILDSKDEIAKHLYIHVVDNGKSLKASDVINGHPKQIFLHPNINAGGSGGYARGMMECLHQKVSVTNVLMMDDDVLVLPESICRTYNFLKLLKPEFKNSLISGAMLNLENPAKQHEDIGHVEIHKWEYYWGSIKGVLNQEKLENNLENELPVPKHKDSYAGWWYCCVPMKTIKKLGLPHPYFIRSDDIEYGVRANTNIITLNGICVWHMGFLTKYNAVFDRYFAFRNMLISQATTGLVKDHDLFPVIYSSFRVELLQFNYNAAELILRAVQDFLRGPEWLMQVQPEKQLAELVRLKDDFKPLDSLPDGSLFNYKTAKKDDARRFKDKVLMKATWNGHILTPKFLERHEVVPISFDFSMQPQKITMHTKLIAVNPYERTGIYRIRDKKRFRQLMREWKKTARSFNRNHERVVQAYRNATPEMRSEKFWRRYLGIK